MKSWGREGKDTAGSRAGREEHRVDFSHSNGLRHMEGEEMFPKRQDTESASGDLTGEGGERWGVMHLYFQMQWV